MLCVVGGKLLADSVAVGASGVTGHLKHKGFGEFSLAVMGGLGTVEFVRGAPSFEGCSGRSHFVEGPAAAVAAVVAALGVSSVKEAA